VRPSVYGRMVLSAGVIELAILDADILAVGDEYRFRTREVLVVRLVPRSSRS
jgi:hypothetical protein